MAKTGPSEWTLYMKKVEHFLIHGGYSDTTATHEKSTIRKSTKKFSVIGLHLSYSMLLLTTKYTSHNIIIVSCSFWQSTGVCVGVRAYIHMGGQTEFCPNGEDKLREKKIIMGSFHVKSPRVPHAPSQMFTKKYLSQCVLIPQTKC